MPKKDTQILYLIKPTLQFAFLKPAWVVAHAKITQAPAWGNAEVYRVSREDLQKVLKRDPSLQGVWASIDKKVFILEFQHAAIDKEKERLSALLQAVIDENKIAKIMPKTLDGFFKVCFILDRMEKKPENANLWLAHILSYTSQKLNSYELFQVAYCVDFLYAQTALKSNEIALMAEKISEIMDKINGFAKKDGSYQSDKRLAPIEDTRYALFVINIIEDLVQDMLYHYPDKAQALPLSPIKKIYQSIKNLNRAYAFLARNTGEKGGRS